MVATPHLGLRYKGNQMTQDLCRAEFEKWHTERYYRATFLETRWVTWQAAWNAKPATEPGRPIPDTRDWPIGLKLNYMTQKDYRGAHLTHCNKGEYVGSCKYNDNDCTAFLNPADNSQNTEYN